MSKPTTSGEIRQAFLDYFESKGHQPVASSPLVPGNDPTLLFSNSGMVQFKDVFLGTDKRDYTRATSSQKCMRVAGKHNDLEDVGPSRRHHTFFEMLGNFSFGDYFKAEAMDFAWEFLTEVVGLPADRLAVTVYEKDDESYDLWHERIGIPKTRIGRLGPKDNFWQMAETGPCGPNSEIHWDRHPERGEENIVPSLEADDGRFLEIWNLVFMQFNRTQADPEHTGKYDKPLPKTGVDTGMGLERITAVVQGVDANYDAELFTDIMDATQKILGHDDATRAANTVPYRVIADHVRAASFLIADGVNPGNEGREYIVRMLIRRALTFAYLQLDVREPFLYEVSKAVIKKMGGHYSELEQFSEAITWSIQKEEERFLDLLTNAIPRIESITADMKEDGNTELDGAVVADLWTTFGVPREVTRDLLKEDGFTIDEAGFEKAMDAHREASKGEGGKRTISGEEVYRTVLAQLQEAGKLPDSGVAYDPYGPYETETQVVAILHDGKPVESISYPQAGSVELVLDATSFYVESGGQVSDTGVIMNDDWEFTVNDTRKPVGGLIVHVGEMSYGDNINVGDKATAIVNHHRRADIMRNHTATHLLHASLRETLGEHVRQKGSLVAPDRLRFDFSHDKALTADEAERITEQINRVILGNAPVDIVYKSLDEAKAEGAMALFGEKYGETVRTVTVADPTTGRPKWSYELCGGTHVQTTAEIGNFMLTQETSSSAGVRRIEAVTGHVAQAMISERAERLNRIANMLGTRSEDVEDRIEGLQAELHAARKELEALQRGSAKDELDTLLAKAEDVDGITVIAAQVDVSDGDLLAEMADWCRDRIESGIVVLGSPIDGKVRLVASTTKDVNDKGVHAGKTVGQVAKLVGGGGGGRPNFATAGGSDISKLPDALAQVAGIVRESLT